MSDTPDYSVRMKLHAQRPGPNGGFYVRTHVGGASVSASFDNGGLVGFSVDDDEAFAGSSRLAGVLMALDAKEAYALGHELQLAAMIADASINPDQERSW